MKWNGDWFFSHFFFAFFLYISIIRWIAFKELKIYGSWSVLVWVFAKMWFNHIKVFHIRPKKKIECFLFLLNNTDGLIFIIISWLWQPFNFFIYDHDIDRCVDDCRVFRAFDFVYFIYFHFFSLFYISPKHINSVRLLIACVRLHICDTWRMNRSN